MNTTTRKVLVTILSAAIVVGSVVGLVFNGMKNKPTVDDGSSTEQGKKIPPLEFSQPPAPESGESSDGHRQSDSPSGGEVSQPPTEALPEPQEKLPTVNELAEGDLWQKLCARDFASLFVTFMDEISMGALPAKSLGEFKSAVKFTAVEKGGEWFISEEAENRYQQFVDLFCSIDAKRAAKVYVAMKPSLQKALDALGYKGRSIDTLMLEVLTVSRGIPLYESNPPMVRLNDNMFTWQYEELEKLSPAQKCVMRMGQKNVRRIREQVEHLAAESGLEINNGDAKE